MATSYKQWTAVERGKSYRLTKKAQKLGLIPYPTKCNRCRQDKGIIQSHNEDYGFTLAVLPDVLTGKVVPDASLLKEIHGCLEQLCWRCHQILHKQKRDPVACAIYWQQIKEGVIFPPVYKNDFSILVKEHGVGRGGV